MTKETRAARGKPASRERRWWFWSFDHWELCAGNFVRPGFRRMNEKSKTHPDRSGFSLEHKFAVRPAAPPKAGTGGGEGGGAARAKRGAPRNETPRAAEKGD